MSSAVDSSQHEEHMDKNRIIKMRISHREQFSLVVESHRLRETVLLPITVCSDGSLWRIVEDLDWQDDLQKSHPICQQLHFYQQDEENNTE